MTTDTPTYDPERLPGYFYVTTYNLNRERVSVTRHRRLTALWRAYNRAQNSVHPEGRGGDKPWSGYVKVTDHYGTRFEMDRDGHTGYISYWEVD